MGRRPVHPRSRGERGLDTPAEAVTGGSSPPARGTVPQHPGRRPFPRFIPARAGNGKPRRAPRGPRTVHPRSRGERFMGSGTTALSVGSSPLARGTGHWRAGVSPGRRFIPARAGNGRRSAITNAAPAVHPRSRGERLVLQDGVAPDRGSSPLARGTASGCLRSGKRHRFIPARAGNGITPSAWLNVGSVHPRSRGERTAGTSSSVDPSGSSPLARGTGRRSAPTHALFRFIPARAGNGVHRQPPPSVRPVHPRSRGERLGSPGHASHGTGSSPLARGTVVNGEPDPL